MLRSLERNEPLLLRLCRSGDWKAVAERATSHPNQVDVTTLQAAIRSTCHHVLGDTQSSRNDGLIMLQALWLANPQHKLPSQID